MNLSKDLLEYNGIKNILLYNYFCNKVCIVKKELYNLIKNTDQEKWIDIINTKDLEKLIKNGILIKNENEYLKMNYESKYREIMLNRTFSIGVVYFHVTQRCNLRCSYCYNKYNINKRDELDINQIDEISKKLKKLGIKKVVLTGGEALIRDDIVDIAYLFKNKNIKIELLTNGTMLDKRMEILDIVDSVIISIDTFDSIKNKRKGLDINKLKKTLDNIKYENFNKVKLRSVICNDDKESWKEVKKYCLNHNIQFISSIFIPNNQEEEYLIPSEEILDNQYMFLEQKNITGIVCGAGYKELAIDSNGDVYPCQALIKPHMKIGNIISNDFENNMITSHTVLIYKNRMLSEIKQCESCIYKYLCGGGCPAISYNLYQSLDVAPIPICKFYKKTIDKKLISILMETE